LTQKSVIPPLSRAAIERYACALLQRYQPKVLEGREAFDVESFVEFYLEELSGIKYIIEEEMVYGALGATNPIEGILMMPESLAADESTSGRRRFRATLGHEVGHSLLHVEAMREAGAKMIFNQEDPDGVPSFYRVAPGVKPYLDPEWQAWEMCGSLLMPKSVTTEMHKDGATSREMEEHFDVNGAFVKARLGKLKLKN